MSDAEEFDRLQDEQLWREIRKYGPAMFCERIRIPLHLDRSHERFNPISKEYEWRQTMPGFRIATTDDVERAMDKGHPAVMELAAARLELEQSREFAKRTALRYLELIGEMNKKVTP